MSTSNPTWSSIDTLAAATAALADSPMQKRLRETLPSVVIVVSDAADYILPYLERLSATLRQTFDHYEVIIVDDASRDNTVARVLQAQDTIPGTVLLGLSSQRGADVAVVAGLEHAIGDFVIILDPRLDQPELVPAMTARALGGADVVYALPRERVEGIGLDNVLTNRFLEFVARAKDIDVPIAASSCRLVSRAVLNFMLKPTNRHRILMLSPALSGFEHATLVYDREYPGIAGRARGKNRSSIRRMVSLAARAVSLTLAVSVTPLRAVSLLALGASGLTMLYSLYVIGYWLFSETVAPGWTSLSLQISGLFFFITLVLAVMSEYLLQVLEGTANHPLYYLARHTHSKSLAYDNTLNVISRGNVGAEQAAAPASDQPADPKA